jgi:hypothetical protein
MALQLSAWCVVILASLAAAQPTKAKVSWKFESALEEMRSACVQAKSDSALACFKFKVFSAIDELFKNDSTEVSAHVLSAVRPEVMTAVVNYVYFVRSKVFTAVTMKNCVFCDATSRGSFTNRRFGGT